ncbi:MAG: hypothetical protein ACOYM2_11480, partial [Rectinemataceae bacterium]
MTLRRSMAEVARGLALLPGPASILLLTILYDTLFETVLPLAVSWLIDNSLIPRRADLFALPALLVASGWLLSAGNQL